MALLAAPDRGTSRRDLEVAGAELVEHVGSRNLPTSEPLSLLRTRQGLDEVVGALADLGIAVVWNDEPGSQEPESLYGIAEGQRIAATYYRNTIVHFFLTPAIAELALAAAAKDGGASGAIQTFDEYVARLRDLLANEFFFEEYDHFLDEVVAQLDRRLPGWRNRLAEGSGLEAVAGLRPHRAPWALRSFLQAYLVAAERLVDLPPEVPWNKGSFLAGCLDRGADYVSEGRIAAEACTLSLFSNAVRVAARRGLLTPGLENLSARRRSFASELDHLLALAGSLDSAPPSGTDRGIRRQT